MKCFRCKKEIVKGERHFIMLDIDNEKEIDRTYVHNVCWNQFLKQVGSVEESMGMIRGLKKWFIKQEILPAEEYKIC